MRVRDLSDRGLGEARSYGSFDALVGGLRKFKPRAPEGEEPVDA